MTAILLAVAVWFGRADDTAAAGPLFRVRLTGNGEIVNCWQKENGDYYLFLPSGVSLSEVELLVEDGVALRLNGETLKNGPMPGTVETGVAYDIELGTAGREHHASFTILCSGEIPAMYIDVESGSMRYIHAKKGNRESGSLRLYGEDGTCLYSGQLDGINGRGNATWAPDKKSYSLTLSESGDLLSMGSAQKWILLSNSRDMSNLRNKIVYDFAASVGLAFTPETRWVDLWLNGEYAGLYLLVEHNELHPQRVALEGEGFLISQDMESKLQGQDRTYFVTDAGHAMRVHGNTLNGGQMEQLVQQVENALLAPDGIDPESGCSWEELIDLDSWAAKYLIEEVFGNVDGGEISQYYYYDSASGKLFAGPVWDYDISLGNEEVWEECGRQSLYLRDPKVNGVVSTEWFVALGQKEVFWERVLELYQQVFLPQLRQLLGQGIEAYTEEIRQSATMNMLRWYGWETDLEPFQTPVRAYLAERLEVLNNMWLGQKTYHIVQLDPGDGGGSLNFLVEDGKPLEELWRIRSDYTRFLGWFYEGTDTPFDPEQPITEDLLICGKWRNVDWKELLIWASGAMCLAALGALVIADHCRRKKEEGGHDGSGDATVPA